MKSQESLNYWERFDLLNRQHNDIMRKNTPEDACRFIYSSLCVSDLLQQLSPQRVVFPARSVVPVANIISKNAHHFRQSTPTSTILNIGTRTNILTGKKMRSFTLDEMTAVIGMQIAERSEHIVLVDEVLSGSRITEIAQALQDALHPSSFTIIALQEYRDEMRKDEKPKYIELKDRFETITVPTPLIFTDMDSQLDTLLCDPHAPPHLQLFPMYQQNKALNRFTNFLYHAYLAPRSIKRVSSERLVPLKDAECIYEDLNGIDPIQISTAANYLLRSAKSNYRRFTSDWIEQYGYYCAQMMTDSSYPEIH